MATGHLMKSLKKMSCKTFLDKLHSKYIFSKTTKAKRKNHNRKIRYEFKYCRDFDNFQNCKSKKYRYSFKPHNDWTKYTTKFVLKFKDKHVNELNKKISSNVNKNKFLNRKVSTSFVVKPYDHIYGWVFSDEVKINFYNNNIIVDDDMYIRNIIIYKTY